MSLGQRMVKRSDRFYDRIRDHAAHEVANGAVQARDFSELVGAKYCVLVTYRRSGKAVPTPVWFGLDADGRLYVRTGADAAKVKRIRANATVRVAPSTPRGKPIGPVAQGTARVLEAHEQAHAEAALRANYGLGRALYEGLSGSSGVTPAYIEVTPAAPAADPGASEEAGI